VTGEAGGDDGAVRDVAPGGGRLLQFLGIGGLLPVGAVVVFLGWIYDTAYFDTLGVDVRQMGFSRLDFVLFGSGAMIIPGVRALAMTAALCALAFALNWWSAQAARQPAHRWNNLAFQRGVRGVVAAGCLARAAWGWTHVPWLPGDAILFGVAVVAGSFLVDLLAGAGSRSDRSRWCWVIGLVVGGMLWPVTVQVQDAAVELACGEATNPTQLPLATVYTRRTTPALGKPVSGGGPGTGSVGPFRYEGLRVLADTGHTLLVELASHRPRWRTRPRFAVIAEDEQQLDVVVTPPPCSPR
jgi:hypothetical protein